MPAATLPVMPRNVEVAVDPQPRHQVVGAERLVGDVVDARVAARGCAPRRASARRPACGRRTGSAGARSARARRACRNAEMLRHDPCATPSSTESTIAGRWKASTSFDATMPMTPRCQPSPATTSTDRAPTSGSVCTIFFAARENLGFLFLPPDVLAIELQRELPHFFGQRLVVGEEQPRGDVRRAHAPGGVHARREHEADVVAVDRLAGQAGDIEQRAQARPCAVPCVSRSSPSLAMTRFSPTSGTTSASVPIAATLMKPGQPASRARRAAQRLHQFQRDADACQVLVGIAAVRSLRVDDRERRVAVRCPARDDR